MWQTEGYPITFLFSEWPSSFQKISMGSLNKAHFETGWFKSNTMSQTGKTSNKFQKGWLKKLILHFLINEMGI